MTTDFKASQVQTNKVIVTGSFAGGSANQLLVYNYNADDSGTPNQGIIDAAVFDTSSGIGSDVFLFVSGAIGSKNTANTYGVSVIGGDLHVSGNLTVGGTYPAGGGGGGGDQYWSSTENKAIFTTGSALFRGPGGVTGGADAPSDLGQDIFFYVSGAIGSKNSAVTGTAVFGGDVVISGTLYGGSPLKISGSLQQGRQTQAIGRDSHAAGRETEASGSYSYAGGYGTIASGSYQTIVGKYNERDNPDSLFVVGNGLADPNGFRKDVLRVNGNIAEWPLGRVEVTGTLAATSTVTAVNLTGSLTQLSNGDPYLIAGDGVTIASGSDLGGAVKVSSTDWMTVTLGHSASLVSSNPIYIGQAQGLTAGGALPTSGNDSAWTYRSHVSGTIRKVSVMFHDSVGSTNNSGSFSIINVTPTPDSSSTIDAAFNMGGKQTVNRVYTLASALDINPDDEITIRFQPSPAWSTRYMWGSYNLLIQVTGSIGQW